MSDIEVNGVRGVVGKHHRVFVVSDTAPIQDQLHVEHVERFEYRVTAPEGLFKNGKHHAPGETILLTAATAAPFIEYGEVEEA